MKWVFFFVVLVILAAILYSIEEEFLSPDFLWKIRRQIRRLRSQQKNKIKKRKVISSSFLYKF